MPVLRRPQTSRRPKQPQMTLLQDEPKRTEGFPSSMKPSMRWRPSLRNMTRTSLDGPRKMGPTTKIWDITEPEQDYSMSVDLFGDHDDDNMLSRTRAALSRAQSSVGEVDILEAQLMTL